MTTDERLVDLLVERRERPLAAGEQDELRRRLRDAQGWREDDLELAEAALWSTIEVPQMPERARLRAMSTIPPVHAAPHDPGLDTLPIPPSKAVEPTRRIPQLRRRGPVGWIAAALAAGVAVFGWWPRLGPETPAPTGAALRAQLLERPSTQRLDWAAAGDPLVTTIAGDVVWDGAAQTGYMRFVGLPKNDPTVAQYQLWIFDAARDERYPVDGGVFDVGSTGEALVAIAPKIHVHQATLFAVTLEKPGGVVVSSREHLLTVAKVM